MTEKTWWEAACDLQPDGHVWSSAVSSGKQLLRLVEEIPGTDRCDVAERFMLLCFLALEAGEEIPELWLVDGVICKPQIAIGAECKGCQNLHKKESCSTFPCVPGMRSDGKFVIFVRAEEA